MSAQKNFLIVDDEADIRLMIKGLLEDEGYTIRQAANSDEAYNQIEQAVPDLVILDIWLQNSTDDGLRILETIKEQYPDIPILMISGHGTIETAVNAIKQGAYDFIEKPFKADRLLLMIERALENAKLRIENKELKEKAQGPSELIGNSSAINQMRHLIEKIAHTNSRVLITGEAGTGKEIVARAIHRASQRAPGPFLALNCAILHPERLEQELFGRESLTPGQPDKPGLLEQAHSGTLLLDEVADMPLETQGKIVRVLQEQRFQRVDGQEFIEVDVRVIAATNRDLQTMIAQGKFREDLFYRLNVVPIDVPPLRTHTQDIAALSAHFMARFAEQTGMPACRLADNTILALQSYNWPGNIRQLRNVVERLMIMCSSHSANDECNDNLIQVEHLPAEIVAPPSRPAQQNNMMIDREKLRLPLRDARELFEQDYLSAQIKRFDGNISKMAQFVGMERSALHRKLKQLGISTTAKHNKEDDSQSLASLNAANG